LQTQSLLKRTIVDVLVIVAAIAGVTLLLKKGGNAGASKVMQVVAPSTNKVVDTAPIRPQAIPGQIDNFKEPIALQPMRSWGAALKYCIELAVSADPKLSQPSARITLLPPTTSAVALEIQYTVTENMVKSLSANAAIRDKTDGVTVLVSTVGAGYTQSTLLKLDPLRIPDQRKWLVYNLALPPATTEIHFSIIAPPPEYNVFLDSCAICLPQLRIVPAEVPAPSAKSSPPPK
jgi:hypothetical protein